MRKKYYVDILNKSTFGVTYYDACSKPHSDAEKIANRLGFESKYLYGSRLSKLNKPFWKKLLIHAYNLYWQGNVLWQARALNKIKDSCIFIQYGFSTEAMFRVVEQLKRNGNQIILLIHDFDSFRLNGKGTIVRTSYLKKLLANEKKLLNSVDVVIAHTQPMMEKLKEMGYHGKVELLHFFDYLNDYQCEEHLEDIRKRIDITFAGNLHKSIFLQKLHNVEPHADFHFFLYGKGIESITTNNTVVYKGVFLNDDIAAVEGTWGLVWDGESTDTCKGNFGEYLRINAPFKFSLYLAKGLPVIVWNQSAMAYYVEKYALGITVNSLDNIYESIKQLTDEQVVEIKKNVCAYSQRIKRGKMLTDALDKHI